MKTLDITNSYRKAVTCMATEKMWNNFGVKEQMKEILLKDIPHKLHNKVEFFEDRESPIKITLACRVAND